MPASWPARSSRPAPTYGHSTAEAGRVVNLEFISANPTGPLHIGHTRWAALGDAMRRLLTGRRRPRSPPSTTSTTPAPRWTSSAPRCSPAPPGQEPPEDGYPGDYVADRAAEVLAQRPDLLELDPDEAPGGGARPGLRRPAGRHPHAPSTSFGVHFDVWFSERSLHEGRAVEQAVARLREQGHVFDSRGRGVAAHDRLRRRQGPRARARPTAARPTSPPTPPTT